MIGETAENFTLKDQFGRKFEFYSNLDKKILLVFYPKDNSPVCTKQLSEYHLNKKLFDENNIRVVGINTEGEESHLSFCNALHIDTIMLADSGKEVSRKFGALNLLGMNKRKVVLIGKDRRILYEKSVLPFYFLNSNKLLSEFKRINAV